MKIYFIILFLVLIGLSYFFVIKLYELYRFIQYQEQQVERLKEINQDIDKAIKDIPNEHYENEGKG